jgi:hypothetical protein
MFHVKRFGTIDDHGKYTSARLGEIEIGDLDLARNSDKIYFLVVRFFGKCFSPNRFRRRFNGGL